MIRTLRRTTARLAVVVAGLAVAAAVPLTPAHAAGDTTRPDIYGCFTWGDVWVDAAGTVVRGAYAGQPVWLEYWKVDTYGRGSWVSTRNANTNSSGCIRFNDISPGHYYHLYAQKVYSGYPVCSYYAGQSGYVWSTTSDALYRMGTTYVDGPHLIGC